jgi:hypothetical protein
MGLSDNARIIEVLQKMQQRHVDAEQELKQAQDEVNLIRIGFAHGLLDAYGEIIFILKYDL